MPRELPILFCTEMIEAFLDGRKTQTRRIEGLKVLNTDPDRWNLWATHYNPLEWAFEDLKSHNDSQLKFIKPRYQVGDHLYAKETWAADRQYDSVPPRAIPVGSNIWFPDHLGWKRDKHMGRVRTGRFMPKKFARIWREVTEAKDPHRLQDISEEDAIAEGSYLARDKDDEGGFVNLWDTLHPKPGERWGDNPWVLPYVLRIQEKLQ